tara:strand:+ start:26518 stop:27387 length:870 start_codon:yes stop_codon:yes gene_type:complete
MTNIGIIGNGFVGSSVAFGFSAGSSAIGTEVRIYDKDPSKTVHSFEDVVKESDFLFICLPTPMKKSGKCDLSIIEDSLSEIDTFNETSSSKSIVILKSTIVPGTTNYFNSKFKNLDIIFNPEFLTEKSARMDFLTQSRIILGGEDNIILKKVESLFLDRFKNHHTILMDSKSAELVKYFCNIFFAVKVSFANEMYGISQSINADWDKILEGVLSDGRIADSHLNVPGHDGKQGFGGSCFPKDINALITFCDENNIDINVVKAAWETNLKVRPEKDWEKLLGRAVSSNDE